MKERVPQLTSTTLFHYQAPNGCWSYIIFLSNQVMVMVLWFCFATKIIVSKTKNYTLFSGRVYIKFEGIDCTLLNANLKKGPNADSVVVCMQHTCILHSINSSTLYCIP